MSLHAAIIAMLLLVAVPAAADKDPCRAQIPVSLQVALAKAFPTFRLPLANDNVREHVEWELQQGRNGCLAVATGDFDGDTAKDRLIGLTSFHGSDGLVVVALARGETWKLHQLSKWSGGRATLYASTAEPGLYERAGGLDGPLEAGEVDTLECPRAVAIFGQSDVSGVAYCYSNDKWQHVWISD